MKAFTLRPMLLQLRLSLARFGWGNIGALLFCALGAATWLWGMPYLRMLGNMQQRALASAKQTLKTEQTRAPVPKRSIDEERLAQFYDALGESGYAEQQVKTLFAIAAKTGLTLNQADYKLTENADGRYQIYQVGLPVHGPYHAIREFCEQTLLAIPFASLDQIGFRRDAIGNAVPEAHLRLTFYLTMPKPAAVPATTAMQGGRT